MKRVLKLTIVVLLFCLFSCKNENFNKNIDLKAPHGMIWVKNKTFLQGAKSSDVFAMPREKPAHNVTVDGFYIDINEVTNKQFKSFVDATNYITVAESSIDWEQMKKELPEGIPKPHDSILKPGSLVFNKKVNGVANMQNYEQWWTWKIGANWKHPQGPESSIIGKENFPVVHIAYEDALAYCKWANRRLPTEAEWEAAAQGNNTNAIFTWGNDDEILYQKANTWQGVFPTLNKPIDGFKYLAPVKSFEANSIGIFDMSGNVWEMTNDLYDVNYYKILNKDKTIVNPKGSNKTNAYSNTHIKEIVIKGGSFLCNVSYCASFRISARMGMALDSGADHIGFRTVTNEKLLLKNK